MPNGELFMARNSILSALVVAASLAAVPAFAANTPNQTNNVQNTTVAPGSGTTAPSQVNPLLTDQGQVRMSKLIGTNVYNDQDKKLGSVDDVVMGKNGEPEVIMKADGNLHAVPWSKLQFGNAKQNSDNKVIMQGETENALTGSPQYHYLNNADRNG
jgi:hypothetical protein